MLFKAAESFGDWDPPATGKCRLWPGLQEVEDTLEEEGTERPEHGSAVEHWHGSDDLFIRLKLDQLEPVLQFLSELAVLDRYRNNPSSGDGFGRVFDWWQLGWRVPSSDQTYPPASNIIECYGENIAQQTVACLPPGVERKPTQVMLRKRLSNLLDIVKHLRQMAHENGTGQMRTLTTRLDSTGQHV